jgi:hypothetical protein
MKNIPVGATIAHGYRFAFTEFFNLLKLVWLPLAGFMILNILVVPQISAISRGIATHDYSAVTMSWPLLVLLYAITLILSFMQITAIFQYALEQPEARHRRYYFSLAEPLWRLIGALLLLILALLGILIAYAIAIFVVLIVFRLGLGAAHVSDNAMKGIATFDVFLAFLIGYCGFVFCGLRFGFLLSVTTIAEARIGLFRSWTLSHGNFWRIFVIALAIILPFLIIEGVALYALGIFPHVPTGATLAEIQALQNAASAAVSARMQHYWYLVYPCGAILALLLYGLAAGAQTFAYRALTEADSIPSPL